MVTPSKAGVTFDAAEREMPTQAFTIPPLLLVFCGNWEQLVMRQLEIARRQLHFFQAEGACLSFAQKSLLFVLHEELASSPTLIRLLTVKLLSSEKKNLHVLSTADADLNSEKGDTHRVGWGSARYHGCACCILPAKLEWGWETKQIPASQRIQSVAGSVMLL